MRWVKYEIAEHKMGQIGVRWKFKNIKWSSIDGEESKRNQARVVGSAIIDDTVLKYALIMEEDKSVFHSIVVRKVGRSYIIMDGNHRYDAYELLDLKNKPDLVDCYVVETDDPKKLELLTRCFNTIGGVPQRKEESLMHIMKLIGKWPSMTSDELCKAFSLKADQVSKARRIYNTNNRLDRLGIHNHGLRQGHLLELSRLKNDNVMKRVAQAACDRDMTVEQVTETVVAANSKRTEKGQVEAVASQVAYVPLPKTNRRYNTTAIRDRLNKQMASLIATFNNYTTLESLQLTADQDIKQALYGWETLESKARKVLYAKAKISASNGARKTIKKRPAKSRR